MTRPQTLTVVTVRAVAAAALLGGCTAADDGVGDRLQHLCGPMECDYNQEGIRDNSGCDYHCADLPPDPGPPDLPPDPPAPPDTDPVEATTPPIQRSVLDDCTVTPGPTAMAQIDRAIDGCMNAFQGAGWNSVPADNYRNNVSSVQSGVQAAVQSVNQLSDRAYCSGARAALGRVEARIASNIAARPAYRPDQLACVARCISATLLTYAHGSNAWSVYAYAAGNLSDEETPGSALLTRNANCVGFSSLTVWLMRELGINARLVAGDTPWDANSGHAWVQITYPDGRTYWMEPQNASEHPTPLQCTHRH